MQVTMTMEEYTKLITANAKQVEQLNKMMEKYDNISKERYESLKSQNNNECCEFCNGNEETIMYTSDGNSIYIGKGQYGDNSGKICLINSDNYTGNEVEINYCPMCGKKLGDNTNQMSKSQGNKLKYIQTLLEETGNSCFINLYKRWDYVFSIEIIYFDELTTISESFGIKEFDELNPHIIVNDLLDKFDKFDKQKR